VLFHEFGEDSLSALELGFELLDSVVPGVINGLAVTAVVEQLLEPAKELIGVFSVAKKVTW